MLRPGAPLRAGQEPQKVHQALQADVWAPETEILLDRIGVEPGWKCADLACGPAGILGILARRVGSEGLVIGADRGDELARQAQHATLEAGQLQVQLVVTDLLDPALGESSFDLVHLRFALHLVDPEAAVARMTRLAKPGGFVAIQEPDLASWRYRPATAAWPRLLAALTAAIADSGDPNVGRRAPDLLEAAGLEGVSVRCSALTLGNRHPHMRLPLAWAAAQREVIVGLGLARPSELDAWIEELEEYLEDEAVTMVTPTTIQAWGRRPKPPENTW
ncbi:MAG TPA: methyltransferase domain-containing protein [Candidatus Eisenbacteria bacterium]|nr:methyltransferase domain-containing protein [Candidatus Eisenbacteria bacterium]